MNCRSATNSAEVKQRTDQQRKAIEVYCRNLADKFNEGGIDKQAVFERKSIPVPWTQEAVKEDLFKAVMNAICWNEDGTPKESTTELTTIEVSEVYKHLDKWTGEEWGIHVPWPDRFNRFN